MRDINESTWHGWKYGKKKEVPAYRVVELLKERFERGEPVPTVTAEEQVAEHVAREFQGLLDRLPADRRSAIIDHLFHQVSLIADLARASLPPGPIGEPPVGQTATAARSPEPARGVEEARRR